MPAKKRKKAVVLSAGLMALFGLGLCLAGALSAESPVAQTAKEIETCGVCHEDFVKGFQHKPFAAFKGISCATCHVGTEKHVQEGGGVNLFAFKPSDLPIQTSKTCIKCHIESRSRYTVGPHGKAALVCTTCHTVHARKTYQDQLKASATKTCEACHGDIFAKFNLNERHRLQEGILDCVTCHDPHEPAASSRLGGFKHEACLKCHTDKGGPFLYEHQSSRVEGCTICHDPHGSPNRHMLAYQSVADLCFSCHTFAPQWHRNFGEKTTNCTTCHSTIHGSNLSKIFLK